MCVIIFRTLIIFLVIINIVNGMMFWSNSVKHEENIKPQPDGYRRKFTIDQLLESFSVQEIIHSLIMSSWFNTVRLSNHILYSAVYIYPIEAMLSFWLMAITFIVFKYVIKGRPLKTENIPQVIPTVLTESNNENRVSKKVSLPNVTVYNSLQYNDTNGPNQTVDNRICAQPLESILHKPDKLTMDTDVTRWFKVMEKFLKFYDETYWTDLVLLYLDKNIICKLDYELDYTFNELKSTVLKLFGPKVEKLVVSGVTINSFCNRIEQEYESIEDYGRELLSMAASLFPK